MSYPNAPQTSLLGRALIPLGVIILGAVAAAIYVFYLQSAGPKTVTTLAPPTGAPASVSSGVNLPAVTPSAPVVAPEVPAPAGSTPAEGLKTKVVGHKTNEEVLADVTNLSIPGLSSLIIREEFTRKLAIAIYGISEGRVMNQNRPLASPEGAFAVTKTADEPSAEYQMSAQNSSRYDLYIAALKGLNTEAAVLVYERTYPLLQAAFEELGMGRRSFHQVVILAIDNLLAAPDSAENAVLIRPKVKFVFKDPELEKLPPSHKFMLRLGANHNQTVKENLRGLRQKLVGLNF